MLFGFEMIDGRWVERVPSIFKAFSTRQKREFFINQYNFCVDQNERISFKRCDGERGLFEIFQDKILKSLRQNNSLKANRLQTFDPYSALLISLFVKKEFVALRETIRANASLPKIDAAKLIFRIFSSENPGVMFNAKMLFSQFVLEKISRRNPDKSVYFDDDLIAIEKDGERLLSIMLCFKKFDKDNIYLAQDEINEAWKKVAGGVKSLYIVFPKNSAFRRHIEVKNPCFEGSLVKLVPYTI